ncbi:hypothetical protein LL972_19480 [Xanthomonas campestris pv. asclepiadis]|uniref:hypothetical protein n=1 Tax=Xanthomonas campestris TaxID=339 RepID=UPI001E63A96A|nr:hypothetical protein [Xanthomonas campestris]MCC4618145.1 hypothetical protein [Xanthomonas campestris pv. asclepiadis]
MSDPTPTQPTAVPEALVKLERLRIRSIAHYATARALRERRNDLRYSRRVIDARIIELKDSFHGNEQQVVPGGGRYASSGQARSQHVESELAKLERQLAGIDAIASVIDQALKESEEDNGDASAFHAAADHLNQTLADWGLSPNS